MQQAMTDARTTAGDPNFRILMSSDSPELLVDDIALH